MAKLILAVLTASVLVVTNAFAAEVGEYIAYDRGRNFHLEFRVVAATPAVEKLVKNYAGKENPAAYVYRVSEKARDGDAGYEFVSCGKVDVKVEGLKKDVNFAAREFDVIDRDRKKIGTIRASAGGNGFVEFKEVDLGDGVRNIVLPFAFEGEKSPPKVTVKPLGWKVAQTPFCKDGVCTSEFLHRISRSKDGKQAGDGKVNTGYIVPGLHVAEGSCAKK